ncbi:hypothetical protein R1sor_017904 [Riccia sorocarpa]|uniref:Uncharacterized protein n=1 Tax=Riccia sorocarpa TaxID=122646 RepID=A0ABD3IC80_9MARC
MRVTHPEFPVPSSKFELVRLLQDKKIPKPRKIEIVCSFLKEWDEMRRTTAELSNFGAQITKPDMGTPQFASFISQWVQHGILLLFKTKDINEFSGKLEWDSLLGLENTCLLQHKFFVSVLEGFSQFISSYPNRKKTFLALVDSLLDPLLSAHAYLPLLQDNAFLTSGDLVKAVEEVFTDEVKEWQKRLQKVTEEILSKGLFHPVHIGSFHRVYAFEVFGFNTKGKLQVPVSKGKAEHASIGGESGTSKVGGTSSGVQQVLDQKDQNREARFAVFAELRGPILTDLQRCWLPTEPLPEENRRNEKVKHHKQGSNEQKTAHRGNSHLGKAELLLAALNGLLKGAVKERTYVPTEDSTGQTHFIFLLRLNLANCYLAF